MDGIIDPYGEAAAFGRLCVKTMASQFTTYLKTAAAFGRLCVETLMRFCTTTQNVAAAFGRLCVETAQQVQSEITTQSSRLRAAVC